MKHLFAKRLCAARMQSGMAQKELAAEIQVVPSSLSNYENAVNLPPLEKACELAKILHTSLDYLTGLSNKSLDPALLDKQVTEKYTFYHLIKYFSTLDNRELSELVLYAQFLKYKRQRKTYSEVPQRYMVADGGMEDNMPSV